jgi:signal transduction histidine kinase
MSPVAQFFQSNLVVVYFLYGLGFFCMGLVVWLERGRSSEFRLAQAIVPLAAFGVLHGLHEWFEMFKILATSGSVAIPGWLLVEEIRIAHLVLSFIMLVLFGIRLLYAVNRKNRTADRFALAASAGLILVWLVTVFVSREIYDPSTEELHAMVDALSRYMLAIPGSLLAAWAIVLERRSFTRLGMPQFGQDLQWAAWTLLLYGVVGQVFPEPSIIFPSNVINADWFLSTFGLPIQFLRMVLAILLAAFMIRALRAFELERRKRLVRAQAARLQAQQEAMETQERAKAETDKLNQELQAREELLAELLHQVVRAQEGERQRIARELHDGTGQILTGLGLGLAAAGESVEANPHLALEQINQLRTLNTQALDELHHIIGDLRPALLDDLGLVAAFQAQIRSFEERTGVQADLEIHGRRRRLIPEVETIIFRIGQEALTNVARHARAERVDLSLAFNPGCVQLTVKDDGQGFDSEAILGGGHDGDQRRPWGLLGIQERVALAGGTCEIKARPGEGTCIRVCILTDDTEAEHVHEDQAHPC